jgi:hypothetical protein
MQPQRQLLEVQEILQLTYKVENLWKTCKFSTSEQSDTDKSSDSIIRNHSDDVLVSDTCNDSDSGYEITYVTDTNLL